MGGVVRPTVAVDFDGVLNTYASGFDPAYVPDPPVRGALDALTAYAEAFQIVVHSTRAATSEGVATIRDWLNRNGFDQVPLLIDPVKPNALVYLDDRGWLFPGPGGFPSVDEIFAFRPWWKQGSDPTLPPLDADQPDQAAAQLAARAAYAADDVLEAVTRAVDAAGGQLVGLAHMLKTESALAGKVENVIAEKGMTVREAAADIRDALRFTAVFDDSGYAAAATATLTMLARSAGAETARLRNYWLPGANPRYADGTYVGVNAVLQGLNGYQFELQLHTPKSFDVQQVNWDFYRILRSGDADPADVAAIQQQMRENNRFVPAPDGVTALTAACLPAAPVLHQVAGRAQATEKTSEPSEIPASAHYRKAGSAARSCATCSYFGPGTNGRCGMWDVLVDPGYVCDEWADSGVPALTAALPVQPRRRVPGLADRHNRALVQGYKRAAELEPRLADVLEPILARAGERAAVRFRQAAVDHLTAAVTGADVTPTTGMVAVFPRPDEQQALAEDGGEPPELIHVTLCLLGDLDDDQAAQVAEALGPVAASHAPLEGKVGGVGAFGDNGNGTPAIVLPSVPGLVELRQAVCEAVLGADGDYSRDYGFVPHATVAYRDPGQRRPPDRGLIGQPLHFDTVRVVRGNQTVAEHPLTGAKPLTAAGDQQNPPPPWTPPASDEIVDVGALAAEILAKTEPVRKAFVAAVMTPTLKAAGLSFDVTNPLAAQALASSARHVTSIAETTRENVRKAVTASYQKGLSIPDAAKLIQKTMKGSARTRATMIARTELAGAANAGSLAATQIVQQATGSQLYKTWLTAPGAPYPRHEDYPDLDGQTVALDELFEVGDDELAFPGDPSGDPGEIINCRADALSRTPTVGLPRTTPASTPASSQLPD